jgi:hypothetical protein
VPLFFARGSSNLLGQSTKTERPGFGKDVVLVLNRCQPPTPTASSPIGAPQLLFYDPATGESSLSGLDPDANGNLDPATNDRCHQRKRLSLARADAPPAAASP